MRASSIVFATVVMSVLPHMAVSQVRDEPRVILTGVATLDAGPERTVGVTLFVPSVPGVEGITGTYEVPAIEGCSTHDLGSVAGWRYVVTPIKSVSRSMTFRLQWSRIMNPPASGATAGGELEVTLAPGESRSVDSFPTTTRGGPELAGGKACRVTAFGLRVSVGFDEFDSRLFATDLWLIDKSANGRQVGSIQTIRTVPHRPGSFYFDSVADGADTVDIFGTLTIEPEPGGMAVRLEAIEAPRESTARHYRQPVWFRPAVPLKMDEVIEVALPGKRPFGIRLRVRQMR